MGNHKRKKEYKIFRILYEKYVLNWNILVNTGKKTNKYSVSTGEGSGERRKLLA